MAQNKQPEVQQEQVATTVSGVEDFFKKNKKNEQIGQKDEEKEEEKATHTCILRSNLQITRLC
jgi:hypothetical protein